MTQLEKLISLVKYPSKEKKDLIVRAYQFARRAHDRQKEHSYLEHTARTANILAEIGMGRHTISAGLLHHILSDTDLSPSKLEKEFGKKILFLVEGVKKLGDIRYSNDKRHIESLIKFFLASSQDLRVLIIKLAERLDILRHKRSLIPNELKELGRETMGMYVPLAGRLGIRSIQRELEDLAFEILEPEHYRITRKLIDRKEKKEHKTLVHFRKSLLKIIAKENITGIETHFRLKSVYSVYTKLKVKHSAEKIYDIKALRVNVPTVNDCYTVLGIIHRHYKPLQGRIKDYIANPKPNSYQSLHTTVIINNNHFAEIQIRTFLMHDNAEFGSAIHSEYKNNNERIISKWFNSFFPSPLNDNRAENNSDEDYTKVPKWIKGLIDVKSYTDTQENFYQNLKFDFPEKSIFVFDHEGIVIDLPKGATVIDFAFALDPKRALILHAAKINKKFVSISTKLSHNDVVEIITKSSAHPTVKWLPFAKTSFAQSFIIHYLKSISRKNPK